MGLTFGCGLAFTNNKNLVDLGITFGKLENILFRDEYYAKAILSIDIGEKWFERLRRKK